MEAWIGLTIGAAFFQNIRFMLQKSLKARLSTLGVTFSRFVFAAPLCWVVVFALLAREGAEWPSPGPEFALYAGVGALAQIVATALLVALFSLRNFAVGVTFSKTETVATAALSAVVLSEPLGGQAWVAVLITVVGVVLMSGPPAPGRLLGGMFTRAAGVGIASGVIFAMASIGYRGAALSLGEGDAVLRGAFTLAIVTTAQSVAMAPWLAWRESGEIGRVFRAWPVAGLVGLFGCLGSLGWFIAFAMQNAAYVKALGQVELVFTLLASTLFFGERLRWFEAGGIGLVVAGILVLVLG